MKTSTRGIAFLERHEGVVLRAYRDVAGVWTIGAGLTKASGVITPRAGMTITRAQATALLAAALSRNYEPAVAHSLPDAPQHVFDGGVSFHFNTGAIARASWVQHWLRRDWPAVQTALAAWNRAGGRVLAGLKARRFREYELIRHGLYGDSIDHRPAPTLGLASWVPVTVTPAERDAVRVQLIRLGYAAGTRHGEVDRAAALRFQGDYRLTVDGVIGPATAATITRAWNARTRVTAAAGLTGAPLALSSADVAPLGDHPLMLILPGLLWIGWLTFTHRDALAVVVQRRLPGLAGYLRSF